MYERIHFSRDLIDEINHTSHTRQKPCPTMPLSSDNLNIKKGRIQPIRQTRNSQFKNNPFIRTPKIGKTKQFLEYSNYKQIIDESIEASDKHDFSHDLKGTTTSDLASFFVKHRKTTAEEEDEMFLEIHLSSLLTDAIEKDLMVISKLPPVQEAEIIKKKVKLPKKSLFKNTVILDLDETLTHTLHEKIDDSLLNHLEVVNLKCRFAIPMQEMSFQIVKRPLLEQFIEMLSNKFEIIVND
jgi:hypothetical protein